MAMNPPTYIVSLYAEGDRRPADCLPDFYPTRAAATFAAEQELARVRLIPDHKRDRLIDWAVRYTIRRV